MGFLNGRRWVRRWCGGGLGLWLLSAAAAWGEELQNWQFDPQRAELSFTLADTVYPEFFGLTEPTRLVVDIPETEMGDVAPEQFYSGLVRSIRVSQFAPDRVRVVMDLAPGAALSTDQADVQFESSQGQRRWRVPPLGTHDEEPTAAPLAPTAEGSAADLRLDAVPATAAPATDTLPIDPYALDSAMADTATVVSVPDLDPALQAPAAVAVPVISASPPAPVETVAAGSPALPELPPAAAVETAADVAPAGTPEPQTAAVAEPPTEPAAAAADVTPPQVAAAEPAAAVEPVAASPDIETVQQPAASHGRTITTAPPTSITFGQPLP